MNDGRLVFTQVMDVLHREEFERCVARHPMPRSSRSFSARDQFLSMAFAQVTFRESLREIEACLEGNAHLFAMGIRGNVTRTNLAYANEHRDWQLYERLAKVLIRKARRLYASEATGIEVEEMVYAIDSTTIDLCLTLFPWATFRHTKAAVKMHTQMDLRASIPTFIRVTKGSVHDLNFLDHLHYEPGSIYVLDRGYVDFARLYRLEQERAYFVTRPKNNLRYRARESREVDKTTGLRCDQTIALTGVRTKLAYPLKLRRVHYCDPKEGKSLVFLSNHFTLDPLQIAALYKGRWRIELFFKWIKQNLRIKAFYGTSDNAVKTQLWIAVCVYLMVACLKKTLSLEPSLAKILQVISVNVFQKVPLYELLTKQGCVENGDRDRNQLIFNGF